VGAGLIGLGDDAKSFDHLSRNPSLVHYPLEECDVVNDAARHLIQLQAKGNSVYQIIHLYS
jgi:hypothetical protein